MSRIFGPIRQLGYAVADMEAAIKHWVEVEGVGPWFVLDRFEILDYRYNGAPAPDPGLKLALANSGDLQIELLYQPPTGRSMLSEFLARHPTLPPQGLMQHWSAWCDDYDAVYARAVAAGYSIAAEGRTVRVRFAYFRANPGGADGIEISDNPPASQAFRARIRDAAVNWDGSDPIRRI
jgi:hypothetical protein